MGECPSSLPSDGSGLPKPPVSRGLGLLRREGTGVLVVNDPHRGSGFHPGLLPAPLWAWPWESHPQAPRRWAGRGSSATPPPRAPMYLPHSPSVSFCPVNHSQAGGQKVQVGTSSGLHSQPGEKGSDWEWGTQGKAA